MAGLSAVGYGTSGEAGRGREKGRARTPGLFPAGKGSLLFGYEGEAVLLVADHGYLSEDILLEGRGEVINYLNKSTGLLRPVTALTLW